MADRTAAYIVAEMLDEPERSKVNWNKVDWRLSNWQLAKRLGVTPGVVKANRENFNFSRAFGFEFKPFRHKTGGKPWGLVYPNRK